MSSTADSRTCIYFFKHTEDTAINKVLGAHIVSLKGELLVTVRKVNAKFFKSYLSV